MEAGLSVRSFTNNVAATRTTFDRILSIYYLSGLFSGFKNKPRAKKARHEQFTMQDYFIRLVPATLAAEIYAFIFLPLTSVVYLAFAM